MEATPYKFLNAVKQFLITLKADPVNAEPSQLLVELGFNRAKLLSALTEMGFIKRYSKSITTDEEGNFRKPTMMIYFKFSKGINDEELLKMYNKYVKKNISETVSAGDSGQYVGLFSIKNTPEESFNIIRGGKKKKNRGGRKRKQFPLTDSEMKDVMVETIVDSLLKNKNFEFLEEAYPIIKQTLCEDDEDDVEETFYDIYR